MFFANTNYIGGDTDGVSYICRSQWQPECLQCGTQRQRSAAQQQLDESRQSLESRQRVNVSSSKVSLFRPPTRDGFYFQGFPTYFSTHQASCQPRLSLWQVARIDYWK